MPEPATTLLDGQGQSPDLAVFEAPAGRRARRPMHYNSADTSTNTSFLAFALSTEIAESTQLASIPEMLGCASAEIIRQVDKDLDDGLRSIGNAVNRDRLAAARPSCKLLARGFSGLLALKPRVAVAAFVDEDDGVSVVAQSFATSRRVTVVFDVGVDRVHVVKVDEDQHVYRLDPNYSLENLGEELARWLIARP